MKKVIRMVALLGAILLVGLYVATFVAAFFVKSGSAGLFKTCIFLTIALPVTIFVMELFYRLSHKKEDEDQ